MPDLHASRRAALRDLLREADLDALLVTDVVNVRYLSGFTGSNAALLVPSSGEDGTVLCTDGRYTTQAAAEVADLERVIDRPCAQALLRRAAAAGHRRTGFESHHVTVDEHADLVALTDEVRLLRAPGLVERLRAVKDATEIAAIRSACAAADGALAELLRSAAVRPGRTEREVAADLEAGMVRQGAEGPAFASIVAAGANSAVPHHRPTDAVLARGDLVKLDFGAVVDGYRCDMTRTVVLGEPAGWQRDLHDLVGEAQRRAIAAALPGADVAAVDAVARDHIRDAGHGAEFPHGLGHGVGLRIHEAPSLAATGEGTLAAGMTVTVEPGVYLAGRGGVRIEDTLVVREATPEILTLSTKELVAV